MTDRAGIWRFANFARLTWAAAIFAFLAPIAPPPVTDFLGLPNQGDSSWITLWLIYYLGPTLWCLLFCIALFEYRWRALWLAPGMLVAGFWLWYLATCRPGNCL